MNTFLSRLTSTSPGETPISYESFQYFLEVVPDAVVVINNDGIIVSTNSLAEKIFGRSESELIGNAIEILVPERFRKAQLGRGGVFVRAEKKEIENIPINSLIKFSLSFQEGPLNSIEGFGSVKWIRTEVEDSRPTGLGIEFENLTDQAATQIIDWVDRLQTRPYIPMR